ncbi:MAG: UDP-N-acetylmuramoyl-L-alanyl-D-glutamate--2,6-diaminopimelate ligase [Hydrocarboniphaga sp.]|uniref:UDP-N-acetylmuramoyl-L-alanyl-D-glutamate--2, 6-diaminopimelate ligase n=1 Tax=Hydrocarboniphaga sp. TaxID=2033016 RepID=UPI0026151CD5|nr:UDP-N-acetylmuramoyl-L-alanyl-D-glutamate--2,6-diaminopimelate ligase [Hydrocarboniphaga sp.]MDB5969571.1 UDP-N-acetylmuramoyl-L-alanyl-D-glutamate--2,6-diaminopimelate ligase [Hydrocarboniphaga sp.]
MSARRPASLSRLFAGLGAAAPDLEVTGLALDSRRVAIGDLFLAARGSAAHGLSHLDQAIERGAAAVAWEPAPGISAPHSAIPEFAVPRLLQNIGIVASRFYGEPSKKAFVFGVTGTDGKTSTAHLVAQAFERISRPCAYFGTIGYGRISALADASHTTPDPVSLQAWLASSVEQGCTAVSMEVSSHALDQNRVGGVEFDAVALTNVQRDHLDYHGTQERYAAAKRRLFEADDARALILNRDDGFGLQWIADLDATDARARVIAYGLDGEAANTPRWVIGRELRLHGAGLSMTLDTHQGRARLEAKLLGRFNAYNLMAAAAVLLSAGVSLADTVQALAQTHTVPGRIEGFRGPKAAPLVVVDYAHTPQALEQILKALRAHAAGKLWCVFGCGGDRDRGKRPLMGAAAAAQADRLVVTDDNPRSESPEAITDEILQGIPAQIEYRVIHDRAAAIRAAIFEAAADDVVVIAGKGHEDYQIVGAERRSFSDRAFVAELVGDQVRA